MLTGGGKKAAKVGGRDGGGSDATGGGSRGGSGGEGGGSGGDGEGGGGAGSTRVLST